MDEKKKMWLDAETFARHKVTIAPKFSHLLGDALGPKQRSSGIYPTPSDKLWSWQIHHRIKPNSSKQVILIKTSSNSIGKKLVDLLSLPYKGKVSVGIDKNSIL
jgi:hypothetical protein